MSEQKPVGKLRRNLGGAHTSGFVNTKPTAPAAPPANMNVANLGGENTMPLPVGVPVLVNLTSDNMTRKEFELLQKAGWQEGQPIPGDLAEIIRGIEESSRSFIPPVDPNTPPLVVPAEVDFSTLDVAKQQAIQQALSQAALMFDQQQTASTLPPSVQQAVTAATTKATIEITPDEPVKPTTMPKTHDKCAHCNWPIDKPDEVEITPEDKKNYIAAWLGGINFTKTYPVLADNARLTFRDLTIQESDLAYVQTSIDKQKERINAGENWDFVLKYRLALQIVKLQPTHDPEGSRSYIFPESLSEWEAELKDIKYLESHPREEGDTILPTILKYVTDQLPKNSVQRVCWDKLSEFNRLIDKLDLMASLPNF